ncbi:MAG: hypothetical protein ABIF88_02020 [archaeon]
MIIKISPDKEKAKSLQKMALNRKNVMTDLKKIKYSTIIAENYYEIIKELIIAIFLTKGKKSVGENAHKDLIEEISKENILKPSEIFLINELRIKRNNSYYSGKQIEKIFIDNYTNELEKIINTLEIELSKFLS